MPPRSPATLTKSIWSLSSLLQTLPVSKTTTALPKCSTCSFSTSCHLESMKKKRSKRKSQDPYREAQARQRKSANLSRQKVLQAQRQAALGDPVRSKPTPFIESLKDTELYKSAPISHTPSTSSAEQTDDGKYLNFFLDQESVTRQIAQSRWLTEPIPQYELSGISTADSAGLDQSLKRHHQQGHENAERALQAITSLMSGSSKDRTRVNVQRCIADFGRHNTDTFLSPKPASLPLSNSSPPPLLSESEAAAAAELATIPKRVGPDTGSSEVQIAILTTKINVLMENLGKKDKHNKRNLRLLVHRRQKLLKYLHRKERGGPRWMNLVEKLGINDAMWKGEISL